MVQLAILIMAILGLANVVGLKAVCIVVLVCELIEILCDFYKAFTGDK